MAADGLILRPERSTNMDFAALAASLGWTAISALDAQISGVTSSSQRVRQGDLFIALPGERFHGGEFVEDALARGAVAVVTDVAMARRLSDRISVPLASSENPRHDLGRAASLIYGSGPRSVVTYGVTGTNGKTSVAYIAMALLEHLGKRTGLSATSERVVAGRGTAAGLTTPEADELHGFLGMLREASVTDAVIEVSAHAVTRERIAGIFFDVVGFTNLSQDHLDDYADMHAYFAAKAQLFLPECASRGVVCVDDSWGRRLAAEASIPLSTVGSEFLGAAVTADWRVAVTDVTLESTSFEIFGPSDQRLVGTVPIVGDFSATNVAVAVAMLNATGISVADIQAALGTPPHINVYVPGRTEIVSGDIGPTFYVDYGHTAEAFARTLAALRRVTTGRLIMVFGADGDRDASKRADMGRVAAIGADIVIITDFHPRTEDPAAIRGALMQGAAAAGSNADLHDIADPRAAVRRAVALASEGDTILYVGPGHEDYHEVSGIKHPYNARAEVREALREAGWAPREAAS